MTAFLHILDGGLATTLQDLGRPGHSRLGIPAGGAVDPDDLRLANVLVGNDPRAGALEIACLGPTFRVEADGARVAFVGAETPIDIFDGEAGPAATRVRVGESLRLRRGQVVKIGAPRGAAILYMAVEGGFDVAPIMGSVSTYARGGLGGFAGRRLEKGDALPLTFAMVAERRERAAAGPRPETDAIIRVVEGPQFDHFDADAVARFLDADWTIQASDRMGVRLSGPPIDCARGYNIVSDAIAPGSIQVPGDGMPIALSRDHQTTGGYPKIATVVTADLPALSRASAGARVRFRRVSLDDAAAIQEAALVARRAREAAVREVGGDEANLAALLAGANLISGVFDVLG